MPLAKTAFLGGSISPREAVDHNGQSEAIRGGAACAAWPTVMTPHENVLRKWIKEFDVDLVQAFPGLGS
ncbi:hypothetical protein QA641_37310 [Bradyrhizobium sp. CB1650]|uniref:hypothetical protein n=1 Tax=Bradyrhizobium sp. CB1650 TaxID=3039153 RepID=UPI002434F614|nr:hypothetical protein [Bradyrhizobium sp. CB1650]WGD51124.1 hypothetical protein QA641_37310 [Bradyrhizobium sp. CB1650]